jgi:ribosomal protein L29
MKPSKLREMDSAELRKKVVEDEERIFRLRLQHQMGQAEALKGLRETKKDRARMLGILRERELAEKK